METIEILPEDIPQGGSSAEVKVRMQIIFEKIQYCITCIEPVE